MSLEEASQGDGETVLLVEDEPAVQRLAARILEDQGYAVLTAADGLQALNLARDRSHSIGVLVTDVVLPGALQGKEVARGVLLERPELRVIFMSGYPRKATLQSRRLAKGINYLEKPFTAKTLLAKLREALDRAVR